MKYAWIVAATACLGVTVAEAAVPRFSHSTMGIFGQGTPCHFRFRRDGGLDRMTVCVTLRTGPDSPVANCRVSLALTPNAETIAFHDCCEPQVSGVTGPNGVAQFEEVFQFGGRGSVDVVLTAVCDGSEAVRETIEFTSTDLDPSGGQGDVIDLGIWAACYPPSPYCSWSDYNCDGSVDVIDLGIWAGGIGVECGHSPCP